MDSATAPYILQNETDYSVDNSSWVTPSGGLVLPLSVYFAVVIIPAVFAGICANLVLLSVLIDAGVCKSPTRILTVGVCVADLTSLVVALPLQLLAPNPRLLPPSHTLCASAALVEKLSIGSAICFLSCLTLYKYLKICRPHFWQFTPVRAVRAVVICPILVSLLVWPSAVTVGLRGTPDGGVTCGELEALDVTSIPATYRSLLSIIVLIFLIYTALLYFRIFRQLRSLSKGSNSSKKSSRGRGVTSSWQRLRELLNVRSPEKTTTAKTEPAFMKEEAGWGGQIELSTQGAKRKPLFVKASGPWPGRNLFGRRKSSGVDRKSLGTSGSYRHWSLGLDSVSEYDNYTREEMERELCLSPPGLATTIHVKKPLSKGPEPWDLTQGDRKSFNRSMSHQMERMYVFPKDNQAKFFSLPWRNHRMTSNTFIDLDQDYSPGSTGEQAAGVQDTMCRSYLDTLQRGKQEDGSGETKEGRSKAGKGGQVAEKRGVRAPKTKEPRWYILVFLLLSFPVLLLSFLPSPVIHLVALVTPTIVASLAPPYHQFWQVALCAFYFRCIVDPVIHLALQPRSKQKTSKVTIRRDSSPRGSSLRWV